MPVLFRKVLLEGGLEILRYKGTWYIKHVVIPALEKWARDQADGGLGLGHSSRVRSMKVYGTDTRTSRLILGWNQRSTRVTHPLIVGRDAHFDFFSS